MQIHKTFSIFQEKLLARNEKITSFDFPICCKRKIFHAYMYIDYRYVNITRKHHNKNLVSAISYHRQKITGSEYLLWVFNNIKWKWPTFWMICEMCQNYDLWYLGNILCKIWLAGSLSDMTMSRSWLVVCGNVVFCRTSALAEFSFPWQTFQSASDTYKSKTKSDFDFKSQ